MHGIAHKTYERTRNFRMQSDSTRLAHFLRSVRRLTAFGWVIIVASTAFVCRSSHRRSLRSRALWLQQTCRSALRALGVSYTCSGSPPIAGSCLTPNHVSYLDILVLAAITPSVFVAKSEVRTWPVFGWFARMAGTRFVDRERRGDVARVSTEFAPVLEAGLSLVFFLEGTSTEGRAVRSFKSSLLEPAIRAQVPVAPTALTYDVPAGHSAAEEVCWWGDMTLAPHLFILAGLPRVDARIAFGAPVASINNRKLLAATLCDQVRLLHREITGVSSNEKSPQPTAFEESTANCVNENSHVLT